MITKQVRYKAYSVIFYDRVSSDVATEPDTIEWYDIDYDKHIKTTMYATDEKGEMYSYNGVMYDRSKSEL